LGTKDGSLLGYNNENNNYKPLPFDFTRASSATRVNKQGLIETVASGVPRIDYTDANGALKLEPQRTNLVTYSNDFSTFIGQSGGTGILPIITINNVISPDGTLNADKIVFNSGGGTTASDQSLLYKSITIPTTTNYATSFWMKGDSGGEEILIRSVNGSTYTSFTLTTEWKRYYTIEAGPAGGTYPEIGLRQGVLGTINSTATVYLYGAQLELGSYATSYIPTQGSAVTRIAEVCSQTPPIGVIGQTEGTMFFEINFPNTDGVAGAWSISDGSSANRITMNTVNVSSTQFQLSIAQNYNSGSTKLASTNVTYSGNHKVAIKYSATTLKLFVDGAEVNSITTDGFGNYTKFYIGGNQNGSGWETRKFIQADLYNTALTDAELIALTTI
jgi:hypothetical protein